MSAAVWSQRDREIINARLNVADEWEAKRARRMVEQALLAIATPGNMLDIRAKNMSNDEAALALAQNDISWNDVLRMNT